MHKGSICLVLPVVLAFQVSTGAVGIEQVLATAEGLGVTLAVERRPAWPHPPPPPLKILLIPRVEGGPDAPLPVSFGLPCGPGWVADDRWIRVLDCEGREIPVFTRPLVHWWIDGQEGTLRSVLVQFEMNFPNSSPQVVELYYDRPRTRTRDSATAVSETRVVNRVVPPPDVEGKALAYDYRAPKVLAVLPAQWLCRSLVAWQQVPAAENSAAPWYDKLFQAGFEGSLLHIAASHHEPHLFDRIAVYAKAYVRYGEARFLEAALQAADFYLQHLTRTGYFDLKPGAADLKYSSNEGLAILYMLSGDPCFLDGIRRVVGAWAKHGTDAEGRLNLRYSVSTLFWTERHHAFGMLAALHGYEIGGERELLERARAYFEAAVEMQVWPADGRPPDGAWVHSAAAHGDGNGWTTSPWMSAFLMDAIWKYWMLTNDPRAPASLAMYAKFVSRYGLTQGGRTMFYMANSPGRGTSIGGGVEHNVEGIYMLALGYCLSGGRDRSFLPQIESLKAVVMGDGSNVPPRKFNWRFRSTPMLRWLLGNASQTPLALPRTNER